MRTACLIIAGGKGERFWPLGKESMPKQFLSVIGNKSLIRQTVERAETIAAREDIFIITGERYRTACETHLKDFPPENIIYEPEGRDTLPAIAYGTLIIERRVGECVVIVLPSDQYIASQDIFAKTLHAGVSYAAKENVLITIGVIPTRPETGYGYIEIAKEATTVEGANVHAVIQFKEKPDERTAQQFLAAGDFLWNSGIFIWRSSVLFQAIERHEPDTYAVVKEIARALAKDDFALAATGFLQFRKVSIDFTIMEKADNVVCLKGDFGWDDVGSFSALERTGTLDENGNALFGRAVALDSSGSIVISDADALVVCAGVRDLVIVKKGDVVLVYPKNEDARIKDALTHLRALGADAKDYL